MPDTTLLSDRDPVPCDPVPEKPSPWTPWALGIALAIVAAVPFFFISKPLPGGTRLQLRVPENHDMFLHYDQMRDFYNGLKNGRAYPRWEEDTNYGFGAPTMCYYPPGLYYLTSALYPLLRDWMRVLLATHLLLMLASAIAIYWFARQVMSRTAAAVTMPVYLLLPYHLVDEYQRGAVAELLSFVWAPLVLGFAERLLGEVPRGENSRSARSNPWFDTAGFALSYGAFLWSHPPTAYQLTLALVVTLPFLAWLRRGWRGLGGLARIGLAGALGLGLSAAYLYPAAVEQNLIRHEIIGENWPYKSTYVFLHPHYSLQYPQFYILLDHAWLFGTTAIVLMGAALLLWGRHSAAVPAEPAVARVSPPAPSRLRTSVISWLILGGFVSFMMTTASEPIGRRIPEIDIGVFSWRMLSLSTLVVALLAGALTEVARKSLSALKPSGAPAPKKRRLVVSAALVILVLGGGVTLSITQVVAPVAAWPAFTPAEQHINYAIIPRPAPADTDDLPDMDRAAFSAGSGQWTVETWKPEERALRLHAPAAVRLTVRTFNFPGWTARLDGRAVTIGTDPVTGAMVFSIPPGEHRLTLEFRDTPPRCTGERISVAAAIVLLAVLAMGCVGGSGGYSDIRRCRQRGGC